MKAPREDKASPAAAGQSADPFADDPFQGDHAVSTPNPESLEEDPFASGPKPQLTLGVNPPPTTRSAGSPPAGVTPAPPRPQAAGDPEDLGESEESTDHRAPGLSRAKTAGVVGACLLLILVVAG